MDVSIEGDVLLRALRPALRIIYFVVIFPPVNDKSLFQMNTSEGGDRETVVSGIGKSEKWTADARLRFFDYSFVNDVDIGSSSGTCLRGGIGPEGPDESQKKGMPDISRVDSGGSVRRRQSFKEGRSASAGSIGYDNQLSHPKRRGQLCLYYSTPEHEELFVADLRDSFLTGATRLRPCGNPENLQTESEMSISCIHTENWMNISKMGFFGPATVNKVCDYCLRLYCQHFLDCYLSLWTPLFSFVILNRK